jgi:hypothetical protein
VNFITEQDTRTVLAILKNLVGKYELISQMQRFHYQKQICKHLVSNQEKLNKLLVHSRVRHKLDKNSSLLQDLLLALPLSQEKKDVIVQ